MHFFCLYRASLLVIAALVGLSVYAIISPDGASKFVRKDGWTLWKKDGTTITFSLPWKPAVTKPDAKALSSVPGGVLGDVSNVASAILDSESSLTNNVDSTGNALPSKAMTDGPVQVSAVVDGGAGIVASVLGEVNSIVNDATGMISEVVGDATSLVSLIIGGVSSLLNGQGASASNQSRTSSDPQNCLPQSPSNAATSTAVPAFNVTPAVTIPFNKSSLVAPAGAGSPCPAMVMATATIICYSEPSTVTCTVTETWHSTHYESTQTFYSFLSVLTATYTEIVSIWPPSNPYVFSQNASAPSTSPLIACANGVIAERQEDCPPVSISSRPSRETLVSPVTSLLLSVGSITSSPGSATSSTRPTMASFTASVPSFTASSASSISSIASILASVLCADGSVVIRTQDCPVVLSGLETSSLLAFRTSPVPIAPVVSQAGASITDVAETANSMIDLVVANVVSALSNVQGLTGGLLSKVMAEVNSAVEVVNDLTGKPLPTGGVLAVADGNAVPMGGVVVATGKGSRGAFVETKFQTGGVFSLAGEGNANEADEVVSTIAGSDLEHQHLTTVIDGLQTLLPMVNTFLNSKTTTVPLVDMIVNGQPTVTPTANAGTGLLAGLNGGILKGKRRIVNREDTAPGVQYHCEDSMEDKVCLVYGDGGELKDNQS